MTHEWAIRGWPHPEKGDHPRVFIVGAESDHEAAWRCLVVTNVLLKATVNVG